MSAEPFEALKSLPILGLWIVFAFNSLGTLGPPVTLKALVHLILGSKVTSQRSSQVALRNLRLLFLPVIWSPCSLPPRSCQKLVRFFLIYDLKPLTLLVGFSAILSAPIRAWHIADT